MSDRFDHTFEHTLETKPNGGGDDAVTTVRRIEVVTGTGRRRQWSDDDKARVVIESLRPGTNVSEVARRNGLSPQQLFGWRREARALMAEEAGDVVAPPSEQVAPSASPRKGGGSKPPVGERSSAHRVPTFASVVIAAPVASPSPLPAPHADPVTTGSIEIAIGDAVVRVSGQVETALLATVLRAVRRTT